MTIMLNNSPPPRRNEGLNDEKIIERIAVEVMGWEVGTMETPDDPNGITWREHAVFAFGVDPDWNPLTDWNATMQVVTEMEKKGWFLEWRTIKQLDHSVPSGVYIQLSFIVFTNGIHQVIQKSEDRKRSICLAALDSLPKDAK